MQRPLTCLSARFALSPLSLVASLVAGTFGTFGMSTGALAQARAEPGGLQSIVVTAQKRREALQDVPIPVTAFDSAALEKVGAVDMRDIAIRTPGFTMTQFNVGEPQYSIRGISSSSDSAAGEASVAVFVDEVFIGRPAGANFSFLDLERVEVLRGPQGTLFGRNTAGGALSVTTARPTQRSSAKFFASYGNYEATELGAVLNGAFTRQVSAKLAVGLRDRDGYSRHLRTGASLDGGRNTSARLQVLINASDRTSILLSADTAQDRMEGLARVPYPVLSTAGPNASIPGLYPAGTDVRLAYSDPNSFQDRDVGGLMARVEHDLGFGTLTSISAYRKTKLDQFEDLSGLPPPWVLINLNKVRETATQFSQELRLSSAANNNLKWVGGLYFFDESVKRDEGFFTRYTVVPVAGGDVSFNQTVKNKSAALFGQADFALAKQLNLSAGLRFTKDSKHADQSAFNPDPTDTTPGIPLFPGQPYKVVASKSWNAVTGKLGIDYRIDRDKMVYASASRGYKSGLFPSQNNSLQSVGVALDPEKVWNYEIGAKTEWLNRTLRVNATAFSLDYKDLQQFSLTPGLVLVSYNIDAKIEGAELELLAAPAPGFTFGGSLAHLKTKVTRGVFNNVSLVDKELARAPNMASNVFAEVSHGISGGRLTARMEYTRKEAFYSATNNTAAGTIPGYGLVDARLSYQMTSPNLELALWGKNLANKNYQLHVIEFQGNGFSTFGPPRTLGASLNWKFGG